MRRLIPLICILILLAACTQHEQQEKGTSTTYQPHSLLRLDREQTLPATLCATYNLTGKTLLFTAEGCTHCEAALPLITAAAAANNITLIGLDVKKDATAINTYNLAIRYTPTLIHDCHIAIGSKDYQTYETLLARKA